MSSALIVFDERLGTSESNLATVCWRNSKIRRYESLVSLNSKVLWWNFVRERSLIELYETQPDAERICELGMQPFSRRLFLKLTALKSTRLAQAFASYYVGQLQQERLGSFRSTAFRACPLCLAEQFHSEVHQMLFVPFCPIHKTRLQSLGKCPPEKLRRLCIPGAVERQRIAPAQTSRSGNEVTDALQALAQWLHSTVAPDHLPNRTILPKRFFEPDSSLAFKRDAFSMARARTLLRLWRSTNVPISQLLRSNGSAQDGRIQFAVIETRGRRRSSESIEASLFQTYCRVRDALGELYLDRCVLSPFELMTSFRDARGEKSHRALDFLLWRMFWEGAPNLENLKDPRMSEFRRLADVIEQAFFEVFGGFTWIERQFGGAFVIWLFEQVLHWTYTERGRLTDWCQRKGFHLFTRLRGSLLPAMLIQREGDRLAVLYKMCPDQRMWNSN